MAATIVLSERAVATLRFEIKGYRAKDNTRRLPAYRELTAAGIMELVPGSDTEYRFTKYGQEHREEILEREQERIERERLAPPDTTVSESAKALLRRLVSGEKVAVDESNKPTYQELATARIMFPRHGFVGGRDCDFKFTYWGWKQRFELAEMDCERETA